MSEIEAAAAAALETYHVRVEYHAVAYATEDVEARSPEEAVERARELDQEGKLVYEEDHETLAQELTVYVFEDERSLRELGEALFVEKSRHEAMADAGQQLLTSLKGVIGYAKSRAEDMHEEAQRSGHAGDFARWLQADAAVTAAERWIERLRD